MLDSPSTSWTAASPSLLWTIHYYFVCVRCGHSICSCRVKFMGWRRLAARRSDGLAWKNDSGDVMAWLLWHRALSSCVQVSTVRCLSRRRWWWWSPRSFYSPYILSWTLSLSDTWRHQKIPIHTLLTYPPLALAYRISWLLLSSSPDLLHFPVQFIWTFKTPFGP